MAGGTVRVRIPRNAGGAEPSPLEPAARPLETPTDVPGTFITAMPPLPEPSMKELEINAVNAPYSYSRVSYNDRTKEYLYEVIEPQLTPREKDLVEHVKATLAMILGSEVNTLTPRTSGRSCGTRRSRTSGRAGSRSARSRPSGSSTTCCATSSGTGPWTR